MNNQEPTQIERRIMMVQDLMKHGKNSTWDDYAIEYNFRDGKQANDFWRWHKSNPTYYAPGFPIKEFEEKIKEKEEEPYRESEYDNLTLKSAWETRTKDGIQILRSWTNDTTGQDIEIFRKDVIDEIKSYSPPSYDFTKKRNEQGYLAEISFPDFHIGRVSVKESTRLYDEMIHETIMHIGEYNLDKIVYVIGNDWLNVDTPDYRTTRGTQQKDVDDFSTTMRAGIKIALDSIYALKHLQVPIDVIILPGNHDRFRMEAVGLALEGYFHNDKQVNIDSTKAYRKYYQYYKIGFMYEHGELKAKDYTPIFATERPRMWADTNYRYVRCGHLHHNIEEEFVGTEVTFMPSLSHKSDWEDQKGYISGRRGFAYIHDKEKGEIARIQIKAV